MYIANQFEQRAKSSTAVLLEVQLVEFNEPALRRQRLKKEPHHVGR
jgi:hypothetical protein